MTSNDIRELAYYEVPLLVDGAEEFFNEGNLFGKLNRVHFVATLSDLLKRKRAIVLVAGAPFRGAIGGLLAEDPATGDLHCMEYFWYVRPEERGTLGLRLLFMFEQAAKDGGAKRILMMHNCAQGDRAEEIYQKRGYVLKEQVYVRSFQ